MKMVDMKEPGIKGTKDNSFPHSPDAPMAPTVHLEHHHMKALGLDKNVPKVGDKMPMEGHMHVTSVSNHGGKMRMTAELRKMGVEAKGTKVPTEEEVAKGAKSAIDDALAERPEKGKGANKAGKGGYNAASATDKNEDGDEA